MDADSVLIDQRHTVRINRPEPGRPVFVVLYERVAQGSDPTDTNPALSVAWHPHETLAMWPVPDEAESDRIRFVDILTDSDGDGVGDVNERIAGTSPWEATDTPGISTIDVAVVFSTATLWLYNGNPFTRIHHLMTLANAIYRDSGTNIRFRTVGMVEVEFNENGRLDDDNEVMEPLGADLLLHFHGPQDYGPCGGGGQGCAGVGSSGNRGFWQFRFASIPGRTAASIAAHELGHALGLAHSARQGETYGAFRWSRGHFYGSGNRGTLMSYGYGPFRRESFSSPEQDCTGFPCGVPKDEPDGADAVTSLDMLRFQVAAHRTALPDTDGDGFVDPADAAPNDAREWLDSDGDGLGNNADDDDDNDEVADEDDAFPQDPTEWADTDGDGVGDNADNDVADLTPFRDAALRAVVEKALGKMPGEPISREELSTLTTLNGNGQGIQDLTGLELAVNLTELEVFGNFNDGVTDVSPLRELSQLRVLDLSGNKIADLSPLSELRDLKQLSLFSNALSDISALSGLAGLERLNLRENFITDLSALSELSALASLDVGFNRIVDVSPLSGLTELQRLTLDSNSIADLLPLSGLNKLTSLNVGSNNVSIQEVRALPSFSRFTLLGLNALGIEDLSLLRELQKPRWLTLEHNLISDVSPLAAFEGVRSLDLFGNAVSDIGPLVRRSVWGEEQDSIDGGTLDVRGNSLSHLSIHEHIPTLRSWGIDVRFDDPSEGRGADIIGDPVLRALIAHAVAGIRTYLDSPVTEQTIARLERLRAFGAGVTSLAGLEAAKNLRYLFVGANDVADLSALADLPNLTGVDLSDNQVVDISPLVLNEHFGSGDWVTLSGNPLSEASVNEHIPKLLERGVVVRLDSLSLTVDAGGGKASFDTAGYFVALLGEDISLAMEAGDLDSATVEIMDGVLTVTPGSRGGRITVTLTATAENGDSEVLTFEVMVQTVRAVSLLPRAEDPVRQGFMRVINRSAEAGEVRIEAIDETGVRHGPVTLEIGAGHTVHFNSDDLETGNAGKGLSGNTGPGQGDWRLKVTSGLDLAVLSYIRTEDGFLTAMHDLVPMTESGYRVAIFNPGDNRNQVSLLRLINPTDELATITITGKDDRGESPGGAVTLSLDAGVVRTLSAQQLESGENLDGALGNGAGKWRLNVKSDQPILAASLLRSPTGHLTNLSTVPDNKHSVESGETLHHVPLFLSAADPKGRQGFVRVINRGAADANVRIKAYDDSDWDYDAVTLAVGAGKVVHFNSQDLELGNAEKGLSGGVGAGEGDWRLELSTEADIDVLSYIRTKDGFLTSMHDVAPLIDEGYYVPIFNPGSNPNQVSSLRLANPGAEGAGVSVTGVDDAGASPGGAVVLTVPAGDSRTIEAADLEAGADGLSGSLGDGTGKWRLRVELDHPISVMSLLSSPTGHLTNLSTSGASHVPAEQ